MNAKFVAALAVVFAVVVGSAAAGPAAKKLLTGKDIKDGSIGIVDLSSSTRVGLKGPQGAQGPRGNAGAEGPAGPQGAKGDTGAQGAPGDVGPRGPQGQQGVQGLQGTSAVLGVWKGPWLAGTTYAKNDIVSQAGSSWVSLTNANTGNDPATAPAGSWDAVVSKGVKGDQGNQGIQGIQGPQGIQGIQGTPGPGGNGLAGYEVVKVDVTPPEDLSSAVARASCPAGKIVLGGGIVPATDTNDEVAFQLAVLWSGPVDEHTWEAYYTVSSLEMPIDFRLICASPAP